ncbi:MAG: hypothetical protein P4N60_00085 [Verrucomicrobiae bacterium]|nr:hypothetical protein [Verrucomicrobiae bacterium]
MGRISIELQKQLSPLLRAGDLAQCERIVSDRLAALPKSPFHVILNLSITNDAVDVGNWFDDFIRKESKRFKVAAVYTEMNGFCFNPDLWFFNAFAYEQHGGNDDYDWISDWQSEDSDCAVIKGLEPLQNVYASDAFCDKNFNDACSVTDLLVVIKFQDLIRRAVPHMQELRFPLLATAHDYDFVFEAGGRVDA